MDKIKSFLQKNIGITASVSYALVMRLLDFINLISIDSFTFMVIVPFIIGYIPFLFKNSRSRKSKLWAVFTPFLSILIFLLICVQMRIEDYTCLLIIGFPFMLMSAIVSLVIYYYIQNNENGKIKKSYFLVLLVPLGTNQIEAQFKNPNKNYSVNNNINIKCPKAYVFSHLKAIPKLTPSPTSRLLFNFPKPKYSTYDEKKNLRLGYFSQGVVLHEWVDSIISDKYIGFGVDIENSEFSDVPTLVHGLENRLIDFKSIAYEIKETGINSCSLTLSANYSLNTKLQNYAQFWSSKIIDQFEQNLLASLKLTLEKKYSTLPQ